MLEHLDEFKRTLPATQTQMEIHDLEPDTTYFVQVQALAHYGDEKLKSERASMYVITEPLELETPGDNLDITSEFGSNTLTSRCCDIDVA